MEAKSSSKKAIITGWVLSGLAILFLLFDGIGKLAKPAPVLAATQELGYPETALSTLGILLIVCTLIYTIPRFSVVGAVLLTGYLGGAVATQFRAGTPLFSHTLFPVYMGVFVWVGLYLRSAPLRQLLSNKQS
jgi:DoxX-like family